MSQKISQLPSSALAGVVRERNVRGAVVENIKHMMGESR